MKLSPKDRRTLILGVACLLAVVALRFAVLPVVESWGQARRRIDQSRQEIDRTSRQMAEVLGRQSRLERTYGGAATRPVQADPDAAMRDLYEAAQDVLRAGGLQVAVYEPQRPRQVPQLPGLFAVPLQVRGKCKLEQLTKCLAGMRQAKTLVVIDRLSVTNDPKKPEDLEVTMLLSTLSLPGRPPRSGS